MVEDSLQIPPLPGMGLTLTFLGLVLICLTAFAWSFVYTRSDDKTASSQTKLIFMWIAGWLIFSVVATQGIWLLHDPRLGQTIGFSLILLFAVGFSFSRIGTRFANGLPYVFLIGFHVLRLPLEFMLYGWFLARFMPVQMTYLGDNFDILTGILAPLTAYFYWRNPKVLWPVWTFNIIAFGLLLRVISIVMLSSPTPLALLLGRYETEPEVLVGLFVPYSWLAWCLVFFVMILHVVLFRKLWADHRLKSLNP